MDRHSLHLGVSVVLAGLLGFSWARGGGGLIADETKAVDRDIAVVDVVKVCRSHKALLAKQDEMKREYEAIQDQFKSLVATGKRLEEELKQHKQGTAEHDRIAMEVKEKAAECKEFQKQSQKRLQEQMGASALSTYRLVNDEIQRIAEARGFRLVINFSSEPVEQNDYPKALSQITARQILYQNGLDITEDVIQAVN
jgi:Skp family chaperone for outer membrane proteins